MGTAIPSTNETPGRRGPLSTSASFLRAADTAHRYRLHIPENAGDKITLHAKLNYRKFSWFNTHSFAGVEVQLKYEARRLHPTMTTESGSSLEPRRMSQATSKQSLIPSSL
jgi:hypothetical protein